MFREQGIFGFGRVDGDKTDNLEIAVVSIWESRRGHRGGRD
jgi:heme-degrading monooxygenase HmoA